MPAGQKRMHSQMQPQVSQGQFPPNQMPHGQVGPHGQVPNPYMQPGPPVPGQGPMGQGPMGQHPMSQGPMGQHPMGQHPMGQGPMGGLPPGPHLQPGGDDMNRNVRQKMDMPGGVPGVPFQGHPGQHPHFPPHQQHPGNQMGRSAFSADFATLRELANQLNPWSSAFFNQSLANIERHVMELEQRVILAPQNMGQQPPAPPPVPGVPDGSIPHPGVKGPAGVQKKRTGSRCEHGRVWAQCRLCGGSNICEHGKRKSRCRDCGGSGICHHGRQKAQCRDCGGRQICQHGRQRHSCKECGGSSICEHNVIRSCCRKCKGAAICEHGIERYICKKCGGKGICEHGKRRYYCKECGGKGLCHHGKEKYVCRECGGKGICEHGHLKQGCAKCKAKKRAAAGEVIGPPAPKSRAKKPKKA